MFRAIVFVALLAVASAFAPARVARASSVTMMADKSKSLPFLPQPANLVGMQGDVGFDPVGFSNWIDPRFLREAELKHGRIAMLAVLGIVVAGIYQIPGREGISAVEAHDVAVRSGALGQVLLWTSWFEMISTKAVVEMLEGSGREPGYFGFDPLKFSKTPAAKAKYAQNELENGRLAMLAFSGLITQAVLTGKEFPFY